VKGERGFTLIELLVVIAIVVILAVFLVPRLLAAQDRARNAAVAAIVRDLQTAVQAYEVDNNTPPQYAATVGCGTLAGDLVTSGHLPSVPKNPFSGASCADADTAGKIEYTFDSTTGKYTIKGYGRDGTTVVIQVSNF